MTAEGAFPRLEDLAEELRRDPEGFRSRWQVPVLLRRADPTPVPTDLPGGFHTLTADRAVVDAALRQTGEPGPSSGPGGVRVPMPDDVLRLEKRRGGAFADRIGIGRAANVDVRIALPMVSKYHAYVVIDDEGNASLADAKSTFGTFVDHVQIEPLKLTPLRDGASVRLASYELRFHTPEGLAELVERVARRSARPA